jgi:hypothetical protein
LIQAIRDDRKKYRNSGQDARFLIFAPLNWRKSTCLGALSRVYAPRPKRPSAMTAALSFLDDCRIGLPAAIDKESAPAKPGHASRIGDGAADSRHLPVPNVAASDGEACSLAAIIAAPPCAETRALCGVV